MVKKLKRKKQRPLLLLCMIVVGMNPLVNLILIHFAAMGFAAVRRCKWFSEICSSQEAAAFISLGGSGVESLSLTLPIFHEHFLRTPGFLPLKTKKYLHRHPVDH